MIKCESGVEEQSMLGEQVIAEVMSGGVWQRGYVYLGSQLLAIQNAGVYWVHQDHIAESQNLTAVGALIPGMRLSQRMSMMGRTI